MSDNERWSSPKYLLGESYGTTRGAGILNYLRERRSMSFNGLILISVATDLEAIFAELPGNDRPYSVYLPAYAAVAWYHKMVPSQPPALEPFLNEVRAYSDGPFADALRKGDRLSDAERDAVAQKMHEYTGLSARLPEGCKPAGFRDCLAHELLHAQRKTVGRLDGRFVGPTWDPLQKQADYDPQSAAISAAYAATFLDYYHGDLKFGQGATYHTTNFSIGEKWKFTHETALGVTADRQHGRRPVRGALQGREPEGAGAQRLLRPGHAVLGDRVRDVAPGAAAGPERADLHEVLRGGPHDVREPGLDRQDEARPGRLLRRHRPT